MIYYEIKANYKDIENRFKDEDYDRPEFDSNSPSNVLKRKMRDKTLKDLREGKRCIYFVSISQKKMIFRALYMTMPKDIAKDLNSFAMGTGLLFDSVVMEEIPFGHFKKDFIYLMRESDEYEEFVLEKYGLPANLQILLKEELISTPRKKEELYEAATNTLADNSMIGELDRIYSKNKGHKMPCHPAHYILENTNKEALKDMSNILLEALYSNGRLGNRRIYHVNSNMTYMRNYSSEGMYTIAKGGTVVVELDNNTDNPDEDDYDDCSRAGILELCETALKFKHEILTIFCLNGVSKEIKQLLYDNLLGMTMVELHGDTVFDARAKDYLKHFAGKYGLKADKKLYSKVSENTGYNISDLQKMANDWFESKVKNYYYPQYKEIASVSEKTREAKHKGAAIDEVNRMIGLASAKEVLDNALNYYKVQKLYADAGVKNTRPAMHMVFYGNPGTAKTTMARLFAKVMKDNGLLTSGHMVEVGRADLVGKYVGWTAPTIKRKFREAMGGVLFIDEAYSLVDGRDGSYGDEAINTIVQEMENHRDDVIVIFAGYPDKMEGFLNKNPGLRSRIAFHVKFEDYSPEELLQISELMAEQNGVVLTEEAKSSLLNVYESAVLQKDFGNGRFARNMIEQAKMKQASRIVQINSAEVTKEILTTITVEDIACPGEKQEPMRKIGFV